MMTTENEKAGKREISMTNDATRQISIGLEPRPPDGYIELGPHSSTIRAGDLWLRPTDNVWIESGTAHWGLEPTLGNRFARPWATICVGSGPRAECRRKVDFLQYEWGKLPQLEMPLVHRFTPGLYIRQITMPAGSVVISRVHKTTHPFVISKGRCSVWSEEHGVQELSAPHCGITTPATRRILVIHEETVWTTFHPTAETDLAKLEAELTETPDVSYIGQMVDKLKKLEAFG